MEEKLKVSKDTKDTLLKKAGTTFENVKEKVAEKKDELIDKAKESELAGKAKEKLQDIKEGAKNVAQKVTDKFTGKK